MTNIFTYGSLMYPIVWQQVVCGRYKSLQAQLLGYERRAVKGQEYPMIIPSGSSVAVDGVVYLNVDNQDLVRLDEFEGAEYNRRLLSVNACSLRGNRAQVNAYGYIANGIGRLRVSAQMWSQANFEQSGLKRFRAQYQGFNTLK